MPVFNYQAIDAKGRTSKGTTTAHDESGLEEKLKKIGLWLIEATVDAPPSVSAGLQLVKGSGWGKIRRRDLIDFCAISFRTQKYATTLLVLPVRMCLRIKS